MSYFECVTSTSTTALSDYLCDYHIGEMEMKLSQYTDDTTLLLNGDKHSLTVVMDILRWFNKMSGLGINKDKTKVIKIGALRDRRMKWEGSFGLEWTHSFVVLGIHYDVNSLSD